MQGIFSGKALIDGHLFRLLHYGIGLILHAGNTYHITFHILTAEGDFSGRPFSAPDDSAFCLLLSLLPLFSPFSICLSESPAASLP